MTLPKIHRYPGVKPFETSEKELFFGRKRDIQDLYDLISLEKLVVLFGKSGYGKSSLLNAGIVPKLSLENETEEGYKIIHLRLGAFSEEKKDDKGNALQGRSFSPVEFVLHKLAQTGETQADAAFLESIAPETTLWSAFKSHQKATESLRFVLLFDQFEEFFTYPLAEQIAFKQQLATLLYENIPQNIRDAAANLERKNRVWLSRAMDIKIVLAIRSDKMSALDSLKDYLPAILHKRYELKALTSEQAKEAIVQPASIKGEHFHSVPFEYTDAALTKIIAALTEANSDVKSQGVEAFQLQLLCEYLENKVINNQVPDTDGNGLPYITPEQLPVMERLYEEYYHRKLKELPEPSRLAAQLVLEDGLLAEDAATGEGRRMSVDSNALLAQFRAKGLNNAVLLALANTFLIRPETNTVGGVSYEISHDTLLAPIQKTKAERKAREEKEVLAAKAEAEREQKEKAQKQLRTVQLLLGVAVLALIVAAWAIWRANKATGEATEAKNIAVKAQEAAEVEKKNALASDALAKRRASEAEKNLVRFYETESTAHLNKAKTYRALGNDYLGEAKIEEMNAQSLGDSIAKLRGKK
jgi:hypothetical protein